jgi:hypothetical protein
LTEADDQADEMPGPADLSLTPPWLTLFMITPARVRDENALRVVRDEMHPKDTGTVCGR